MTSRNKRTKLLVGVLSVGLAAVSLVACSRSDTTADTPESAEPSETATSPSATVPATGPRATFDDPLDITAAGSQQNHNGELRWSLQEPLTRATVDLPPEGETENDTFAFSWRRPNLIDLELDLPDGDTFAQQAQVVTGSLSRLEGVRHQLIVAIDGLTLEAAEQELLEHAERFGLDQDRIAAWQADSAEFFAKDDEASERNNVNLSGTELGYLTISAAAVANATTQDVAIYWYFDWDPS